VDQPLTQVQSTNPEVKNMALGLFQQWAIAFQNKKDLAFLVDVYHELKNSGVKFPSTGEPERALV
jgi:growth factor-regulated tyrosine kinase substrate